MEIPVEVIREVDVPVEKRVAKYVEVAHETYKDVMVEREVIIPIEKIIEKKVYKEKRVPR